MAEEFPAGTPHAISVLPDVTGIDRQFSYLVPADFDVSPGMIVRVNLAGRRVRAWILDDWVDVPEGIALKPILAVASLALSDSLIELARFASWRYAGRLRPFLLAGSPPRLLRERDLSATSQSAYVPETDLDSADPVVALTRALVEHGGGVMQLPPNAQRLSVVEAAFNSLRSPTNQVRSLLVIVPERRDAQVLSDRLGRRGHRCAVLPEDFARAYFGESIVIGTRNAAFGPIRDLAGIVVLDGQAESYVDERAPTWSAVVVAQERARRAGVPCIVTSPAPPLTLTGEVEPATLSRNIERMNWPALEVIDRRSDDPRSGLYSYGLAEIIRGALCQDDRPVVCVLHRTGRLRLLACNSCGEIARCEKCQGAMRQVEAPGGLDDAGKPQATPLVCSLCGENRPMICAMCHSGTLRTLRVGVARAAEELSALVGEPTKLVTARPQKEVTTSSEVADARIVVGTEGVLHRLRAASLVVFLDFDQHLLAPRFSSSEEALNLLALGGRLVGARGHHHATTYSRRLVIQSRLPNHEVLRAASEGDATSLRTFERSRRREAHLPPYSALAIVSGEAAGQFAERLKADDEMEVGEFGAHGTGGHERYLVRAKSTEDLCNALARREEIGPGLRVEIDPRSV